MSFLDGPVDLPVHSRFSNWIETDRNEIKAYTALQIAMGLCQKNEIADYWGNSGCQPYRFGMLCREIVINN